MTTHSFCLCTAAIAASALVCTSCKTTETANIYHVSLTVSNEVANSVDSRLFGHQLEKASSGEPGPEFAVNQSTGSLPPEVITMMRSMSIPVVRFPGGRDADYTDWRDTINNAPGKPRFRKTIKMVGDTEFRLRFGVDEFCRLKREIGFEAIMVVNLLDALAKNSPVREAAEAAAGLIAYCNPPEGTSLPSALSSWPAIRSKNGNPTPVPVEYVQLGNELWQEPFTKAVRAAVPNLDDKGLVEWYVDCISIYIKMIKMADPSVKIIIDGDMGYNIAQGVLANDYILTNVDYLAWHKYAPGPMTLLSPDGSKMAEVTTDAVWNAWVSALGYHNQAGQNIALGQTIQLARDLGKPVACTEWNWRGWPTLEQSRDYGVGWQLPAILGCASWLNGLIRDGDTVKIGIQSILLGGNWDTTSIRVDPSRDAKPFFMPQGRVTALYSCHHGERRLMTNVEGAPTFLPDAQCGTASPSIQPITALDVVSTSSDKSLFIHAVNNSRTRAASMDIRLVGFELGATYRTYTLTGSALPKADDSLLADAIIEKTAEESLTSSSRLKITIPAAAVEIIELPFRR